MGDAEIIPIGTRGRPGRGTGKRPSAAARGLANSTRRRASAEAPSPPMPPADGADGAATDVAPVTTPTPTRGTGSLPRPPVVRPPDRRPPRPTPQADDGLAPTGGEPDDGAAPSGQTPRPAPTGTGAEATTPPESEEMSGAVTRGAARPSRPAVTTRERHPLGGIPPAEWLSALQHGAVEVFGEQWEPQLARMLAFWRRRITGDYVIDEYGFDVEVTERFLLAALRPLAQRWFRIEVRGADNVPAHGGALVVSNHSGTLPMDGLMTLVSVHDHTGRHLRALGADLVFSLPFISSLARKGGATLACQEDAERMLRGGELVGVWPEGFKGIGKPYSQRYKLQRFGRGGFVSAALRTGVPIIPLAVVGAEEIYPLVGNIPALARLLGVPYVPITPFFPLLGPLGMVPLPSKWLLEFGEPIRTDEYDAAEADDPMVVFNVTDEVRETIQSTLYTLLMERESVFG